MTVRLYRCTQQELYTIAELAWQSGNQHLAKFEGFKPKYNIAFFTNKSAELTAAMNLPTLEERNAKSAILRLKLTASNRKVLDKFQDLKSHIADAFPPPFDTPQYIAAGQNNFDKATNRNWDSTRQLITMATHFIAENIAVLTADQNMNPAFQAEFITIGEEFGLLHKQFLDSEETATIGAEEKIIMNNKLWNDLKKLFRDGQKIFRNEDAIRKQFTYSDIIYLVSGAGTAGMRGTITDLVSGAPIANALITVVETNDSDSSTAEGKYQISPMAHGLYSIKITSDAYTQKIVPTTEILTGTISTFNFQLTPIV